MTEIKQLRGYGHAFERLIALGEEKLSVLEGKMAMAEPSHGLADFIQQEWKLCIDVPRKTLARQISRYRNTMVTPKMALLYEAAAGKPAAEKAKEILYQDLNILDEMQDLMELQKTRVLKLVQQEVDQPILMKAQTGQVNMEIETLRRIHADIAHVYMATGKLKVAAKGVKGEVTNSDGTKSSFQYVVGEAEADALSIAGQSFIEEIDERLARARQIPTDPPAIEHMPEDRPSGP